MTDVLSILKNNKHIYFLLQISWRDPAPPKHSNQKKASSFVASS